MKPLALLLVLAATLGPLRASAEAIRLRSPDDTLVASFELVDGVPRWQLASGDKPCLKWGRVGLRVGPEEIGKLETVAVDRSARRETVKTVWGKLAKYDNDYSELVWTLREEDGLRRVLRVRVRVYESGVALRYEFPADGRWSRKIQLIDDRTEFCFTDDHTGWCYAGEHDPLGPQPLSRFLSGSKPGARLPLTVRTASGLHIALLEAAVFDHAPLTLAASSTNPYGFRATFPTSTLARGDATSWRVILVGQSAGDLLVSPITYCLCAPCQLDDPTWVKPGLAMWDWRAWGAVGADGFTYGLDMPSWKRFIDFASRNNIRYLVLDAGWYGLEFDPKSDPRTSRDYLLVQPDPQNPRLVPKPAPADWKDPIDIPALIRYGRSKDVGIILYFNDIAAGHCPLEETLALYHQWGAAGIKYGFMKGSGQPKVLRTRQIVKLCAEYQLLCDFHDGPVPPSGDRRTYPNYLTREFCHSQSDARRSFGPAGFCEQVFVNMLAGPLDMCNGLYTLENPAKDRPKIFTNVPSTIVAETARVLITFSGLAILPDCPDAYEAHAELFDFLSRLPMTWDETRILHGEVGQYITTARRNGQAWFIGSATDDNRRTLSLGLDFLEPDRSYTAKLYEDAPDSHYLSNREAYRVRELEVKRGDTIKAVMAPGGGHCVYLSPKIADSE